MGSTRPPSGKRPPGAILVLIGVALGTPVAEAGARVSEWSRCQERCDLRSERHSSFGWIHPAGDRGWCQRCTGDEVEWRTFSEFNGRGLRDRDLQHERERGRILILGDSFTEGVQVAQDCTFPKLLERRLNRGASPGRDRFEVINAGVWGWSTDNELLYYVHEGYGYHADLVILALYLGNDVLENHHAMLRGMEFPYPDKPYFELVDGKLSLRDHPLPPRGRLAHLADETRRIARKHSALYRLVARLRGALTPRAAHAATPGTPPSLDEIFLVDEDAAWREAWDVTRALVRRLRDEVEAHGSSFAVFVIDRRDEIARRWREQTAWRNRGRDLDFELPNRRLLEWLDEDGIAAIPSLEEFRMRFGEDGRPGFFADDPHWAEAGHELAAEVLERKLREKGLLPAS